MDHSVMGLQDKPGQNHQDRDDEAVQQLACKDKEIYRSNTVVVKRNYTLQESIIMIFSLRAVKIKYLIKITFIKYRWSLNEKVVREKLSTSKNLQSNIQQQQLLVLFLTFVFSLTPIPRSLLVRGGIQTGQVASSPQGEKPILRRH